MAPRIQRAAPLRLVAALIREHVVQKGAVMVSWMRGMGDRSIGHALVLMHDRFSEACTRASLAQASGLSRKQFRATPLRYAKSTR